MEELLNNEGFLRLCAVFSLIFGMVWGSFLNVCIYRIPIGKSVVFPPSACPKCSRGIKWYENIPVISYIFLRGRCAGCGIRISPVYPVVELVTGLLFLYAFVYFGLTVELPFILFFISSMIVVSGVDISCQIVPDRIVLPGMVLGLVYGALSEKISFYESLAGLLIGGGLLLTVIVVFYLVTRKIGMGGGDVKLLAMIGAFTGALKLPGVLFVASISAILFYIIAKVVFKTKRIAKDITAEEIGGTEEDLAHAIYFGPFLALAGTLFLFIDSETIFRIFTF